MHRPETAPLQPFPAPRVGFDPCVASDPGVQEFFRYWLGLRQGRRLPSRRDIDPADIRHLLPNVLLLDIHRDPLDFEYRLIGDEVASRLGPQKGKRVREACLINVSSSAYRNYCAVVETGAPQFLEGPAALACLGGRRVVVSRVHCPLSSDGEVVDKIFSYVAFLPWPGHENIVAAARAEDLSVADNGHHA
jgi:PAS domain-containing protein